MASTPATPSTPPRRIAVVDDEEMRQARGAYRTRLLVCGVGAAATVALAAWLVAAQLVFPRNAPFAALCAGFLTLYGWGLIPTRTGGGARRRRADVTRALRAGMEMRDVWRQILSHVRPTAYRAAQRMLAGAAAAATCVNRVVCFAELDAQPVPQPFDIPFEPRPLDECAPGFDDLRGVGTPSAATRSDARRAGFLHKRLPLPRWMARNQAMWGGLGVIAVIWLAGAVVACIEIFRGRGVSPVVWVLIALAALGLVVPYRKLARAGTEWYVAPGVLIVRRSHLFRKAIAVQVYDRCHSVLLATTFRRGTWQLTVANAGGSVSQTTVSEDEAEFALRAFLSPLTPPDAGELGDFR